MWLTIIDFIRIERIPISSISSLTNAPFACFCVAIYTSPLLTLCHTFFSYKIEEKSIWPMKREIKIYIWHEDMWYKGYNIEPNNNTK